MHPMARCTSGELLPVRRKYREVQNHTANVSSSPNPGKLTCFSLICVLLSVIVLYFTVPLRTTRILALSRKRIIGFAIESTYASRISANHFDFSMVIFLGRVDTIRSYTDLSTNEISSLTIWLGESPYVYESLFCVRFTRHVVFIHIIFHPFADERDLSWKFFRRGRETRGVRR